MGKSGQAEKTKAQEIVLGDVRVSLLSDTLVRIEDRGPKGFEDRPSYAVPCRSMREAAFEMRQGAETEIAAKNFTVHVPKGASAKDVYITSGGRVLYRFAGETGTNVYLPSPSDELKSWYFTDTPRVIPSSYGYTATEEKAPLQGWDFGNEATDIYVFLPQGDYMRFCADYVSLTGRSELAELATLGAWDSRWYAYSEETALQQIRDYRSKGYPLDVLVIDVDWKAGNSLGGGGIGYAINEELFPDMARFLKKCKALGVRVCFNDHPEPKAGTSNGLDGEEVAFRGENLTRLLEMGLDYWWYDRNWHTALHSFDPEVSVYAFGMYLFHWIEKDYFERAKSGKYARRAVIMGNVDGCLNGRWNYASDFSAHRYAIQWTGDVQTDGKALAQEVCTAVFGGAEVGLPYVSSDIGGHTRPVTDDMYVRWVQYGALSAIYRVHCTTAAYIGQEGRMPWLYGKTAEKVAHTYVDMRYRLLPLLYTAAYEHYGKGLPILRRLDIDYPQYAEAKRNDEYLLGGKILVAPIAEAPAKKKGVSRRDVFLPDGTWLDVWTGKRVSGPVTVEVEHPLETSPIFVREGTLLPLAEPMQNTGEKDWSRMALDVYPSVNFPADATLYEDDAETVAYRDGQFRTTALGMTFDRARNTLVVTVGKAQGAFEGRRACALRSWNVRVHRSPDWGEILFVRVDGAPVSAMSHERDETAKPFAFSGAAADGALTEFTFSGPVDRAHIIEIAYASAAESAVNAAYDRAGADFTLVTETASDFAELAAKKPLSCVPAAYGEVEEENGDVICSKRNIDWEITTTGREEVYVFCLGGTRCTAKLTVRDRAGNVRTCLFGNRKKDFKQRAVLRVKGKSTLYVTYAVSASEHDGTNSPSRVKYFGGYRESGAAK